MGAPNGPQTPNARRAPGQPWRASGLGEGGALRPLVVAVPLGRSSE